MRGIMIAGMLVVVVGRFVDSLAYTRAKFLTIANFSKFIPSSVGGAVVLYYSQSNGGKISGQVFNLAITDFAITNSTLNFYRVEGPYNPEIIANELAIETYPSLAYYPENSSDVESLYVGTWGINDIVEWMQNLPAESHKISKESAKEECRCGSVTDKYNELGKEVKAQRMELKELLQAMKNQQTSEHNWIIETISLACGIAIGYFIYTFIQHKRLSQKHK
eukprot:TRINITY_DN26286_c0_g2_i2.p1 TRINITY_DN26286_c0_g2~~TRINITY_DN26286_c0_g2_i2.p1  ORF type:complete len:221 (-),score=24.82 TRINITY_DN26286_c0_g2_i2:143-805(-)